MSLLTTLIVLAIFYGSGAVACHKADTGTCRPPETPAEWVVYEK